MASNHNVQDAQLRAIKVLQKRGTLKRITSSKLNDLGSNLPSVPQPRGPVFPPSRPSRGSAQAAPKNGRT